MSVVLWQLIHERHFDTLGDRACANRLAGRWVLAANDRRDCAGTAFAEPRACAWSSPRFRNRR